MIKTIDEVRDRLDIGCPVCKTRLVFSERGNFETLSEHVGNPNGYVSEKDGFGCPNNSCDAHKHGLIWLSDGEGPYSDSFEKIDYIHSNSAPFRTWHRKHEAEKDKQITMLNLSKVRVILEYWSRADENGKKNYLFTRFKFRMTINNVYYNPGINMFVYSIKSYVRHYNRPMEFREHKDRLDSWDKRWWSRLSFAIAKVVWRKDYMNIGK